MDSSTSNYRFTELLIYDVHGYSLQYTKTHWVYASGFIKSAKIWPPKYEASLALFHSTGGRKRKGFGRGILINNLTTKFIKTYTSREPFSLHPSVFATAHSITMSHHLAGRKIPTMLTIIVKSLNFTEFSQNMHSKQGFVYNKTLPLSAYHFCKPI